MTAMMERLCKVAEEKAEYEYSEYDTSALRPVDNWPEVVRALLAELKKPSEGMLEAGKLREVSMPLGNGQEIHMPGLGESGPAAYLRMLDAIESGGR